MKTEYRLKKSRIDLDWELMNAIKKIGYCCWMWKDRKVDKLFED